MKIHQETELELVWLARYLPKDFASHKKSEIRQGYIDSDNHGIKDIRIREKDGIFTYTIKKFLKNPQETGYNKEVTRKLSKKEFLNFWRKAKNKTRKIRYYYPLKNGFISEIDVYKDNLKGLVVVEVEFKTVEEYKKFKVPDWFGKEVTDSKGVYPPFIAEMDIHKINEINRKYVQKPHQFE